MDKRQAVEIARRYAEVVREHMSVTDIILYGSYAKETAGKDSDIDIAVIVDEVSGDYLDNSALLWKLTRNISDIIEPALITEDDAVSGFLGDIKKTGIAV